MNKKEKVVNGNVFDADSLPYGLSYGKWTVRWWKWAMSIPLDRNPILDMTGFCAGQKQTGPVWFLTGVWATEDKKFPYRKCSIPSKVSVLFPVLNCEMNRLEYPELNSNQALLDRISYDMNSIVKMECSIDGESIKPERIVSDPQFFPMKLRNDLTENKKGGPTMVTSDGYWVFLKSLSLGDHIISFDASCQFGKLSAGATYKLSVTPKNKLNSNNTMSNGKSRQRIKK